MSKWKEAAIQQHRVLGVGPRISVGGFAWPKVVHVTFLEQRVTDIRVAFFVVEREPVSHMSISETFFLPAARG